MGIYKLFFANDSPTRNVVFVNEEIGISGKVTGYNKARGFKIYINSSEVPYNFDSFQSREVAPNFSLGYYLEHGDSLTKSPNSSVVVVTRNGQVSEWHFVKPATPAQ
jgi:hypothetical protein